MPIQSTLRTLILEEIRKQGAVTLDRLMDVLPWNHKGLPYLKSEVEGELNRLDDEEKIIVEESEETYYCPNNL